MGFAHVKIPEPLFVIINPIVRLLLRCPIHGFWSKGLLLITFTGKKSGRQFTTPVRYVRIGNLIRCFTSFENMWWRNLRGGADVALHIQGEDKKFVATPIEDDPERVRAALVHYLGVYPQDAAYHQIRLNKDRTLVTEDLDRALNTSIVVEAQPAELASGAERDTA